MTNELTTISPIALDAVTGGYHDPPSPPEQPSSQSGIAVGEPHPTSLPERLGRLVGQIGPMIRLFSR